MLSYGAWVSFGFQFGVPEAKQLIERAVAGGMNFLDNAEVYANGEAETIMGQAVKELGYRRSDLVISTKVTPPPLLPLPLHASPASSLL